MTLIHCTVYCTVPIYARKSLNLLNFPTTTNSSKAEIARSNRAGQARKRVGDYYTLFGDIE